MSKIGKQPIVLPKGAVVQINEGEVVIKGPKGELRYKIPPFLKVERRGSEALVVRRLRDSRQAKAMHGTMRALLNNAVIGVTQGWQKALEVVGTGYRVRWEDKRLVLQVGFSHPVYFTPPEGVTLTVEENKIIVSGPDKEKVGNVAAKIRQIRPPDPYKGKGIRYVGEVVKLKPGKAAKAGGPGGGG